LAKTVEGFQRMRELGIKVPELSLHMVFHGNPGTGKTMVARLLGKIYKELGVSAKGHLVEAHRAKLVGGYVGQTALKTAEVVSSALGGVLLIDEAYALAPADAHGNDYGQEAIDTLVKLMEDHRNDLVVIVAGYPEEMKRFIASNPGLQSRFERSLTFDDYSPQELFEIFNCFCKQGDHRLTESATQKLSVLFQSAYETRDKTFGNARFARTVFEQTIQNQLSRIANPRTATREELTTIEGIDIPASQNQHEERTLGSLLNELNSLIGLSGVKAQVNRIASFLKAEQLKKSRGLPSAAISHHMEFHGNPGTGKSTVARLMAQILRALGLLSRGHLVEAERSKLVGGYLGETALKTKKIIEEALGGVLFIDEAYSLANAESRLDPYGREAIETLLKNMEDHRDNLVVIVAGYPDEMATFFSSNPGLKSRFNHTINFEDYSPEEMSQIFSHLATERQYRVSPAAAEKLQAIFDNAYKNRDRNFGNGRFVRNLFESSLERLAARIVGLERITDEALMTIEAVDIPDQETVSTPAKKREPIGFGNPNAAEKDQ
jgi:SpoVK/Ycf46/Vps4 family AAA+-type ATPase